MNAPVANLVYPEGVKVYASALMSGAEPELVGRALRVIQRASEIELALRRLKGLGEDETVPHDRPVVAVNWDGFYPEKPTSWWSKLRKLARRCFLGVGIWTAALAGDGSLDVQRSGYCSDEPVEQLERRSMGCGHYYFYQQGGDAPIAFSRAHDGRLFFH
ncbi:MAG: hypothetical protein KC910_06605 [Candidatus Eremiobacteraeota bacterium]|nr:hypothetical protein [Candidatus Eremiobacteraeota bacterium]